LEIVNEIPIGKGLGSSAAALTAGVIIAEQLLDLKWKPGRILDEAARLEGHPDNVSACVLGSIVASAVEPGGLTRAVRLEMPERFQLAVVIPNFALPTKESRAVLPECYSRADATFNIQRAGLLVAALATGDPSVFPTALDDRLHQPFRAQLVPGLSEILRLRAPGLLGCVLSGAGPGVLVFYERGYDRVCDLVRQVFAMNGCTTEIVDAGVSERGFHFV
ncbi:MAG: homoserine kinase, partial [Acidobacteriota bacterium]|nr:homoserine kinase [Acidobacteriota bacterium]